MQLILQSGYKAATSPVSLYSSVGYMVGLVYRLVIETRGFASQGSYFVWSFCDFLR